MPVGFVEFICSYVITSLGHILIPPVNRLSKHMCMCSFNKYSAVKMTHFDHHSKFVLYSITGPKPCKKSQGKTCRQFYLQSQWCSLRAFISKHKGYNRQHGLPVLYLNIYLALLTTDGELQIDVISF